MKITGIAALVLGAVSGSTAWAVVEPYSEPFRVGSRQWEHRLRFGIREIGRDDLLSFVPAFSRDAVDVYEIVLAITHSLQAEGRSDLADRYIECVYPAILEAGSEQNRMNRFLQLASPSWREARYKAEQNPRALSQIAPLVKRAKNDNAILRFLVSLIRDLRDPKEVIDVVKFYMRNPNLRSESFDPDLSSVAFDTVMLALHRRLEGWLKAPEITYEWRQLITGAIELSAPAGKQVPSQSTTQLFRTAQNCLAHLAEVTWERVLAEEGDVNSVSAARRSELITKGIVNFLLEQFPAVGRDAWRFHCVHSPVFEGLKSALNKRQIDWDTERFRLDFYNAAMENGGFTARWFALYSLIEIDDGREVDAALDRVNQLSWFTRWMLSSTVRQIKQCRLEVAAQAIATPNR